MIRVLQIVGSMDRGGIETFLMNVYRNLDRSKVQFDFLMHTDNECAYNDEIRSLGGNIYSVPARNKGIVNNKKSLNKFFEKHNEYKIVHQHLSSLSYIEPLKFAKKNNIPIRIVHSHSTNQGGNKIHKILHGYNKQLIKQYASHYFACSDLAAKWLYGSKQYDNGDYKIINNGIESQQFKFDNNIRFKVRAELGIDSSTLVVGHIGRFAVPKNHDFLIEVFNEVYKRNSNALLLLVGDGELRQSIDQKVKKMKLKDNVIFTGVRSDIPNILQAMDVVVFPSLYEGLPVTLVEAQATGLSCVVSSSITKRVHITDHIKFIDLEKDAKYWSDAVLNLPLDNDRKYSNKKIIDSGFDIKDISKSMENFYLGSVK